MEEVKQTTQPKRANNVPWELVVQPVGVEDYHVQAFKWDEFLGLRRGEPLSENYSSEDAEGRSFKEQLNKRFGEGKWALRKDEA